MKRKSGYVKKSIEERLNSIYDKEDAKEALKGIRALIDKYRKKIKPHYYKMSEKDIILITYGDQVRRPNEEPLESLKHFLDERVKEVINTVHILPFYPYSSDDGFSVIDYCKVSPMMGNWEHIRELSKEYRLMFDAVINHMSQYSDWFLNFLKDDEEYENFFVEVDPTEDLSKVVRPRTTPVLHGYKDASGKIRYVWTTFSKDQVDLNYANYKVLLKILEVLFCYVEKGARLIRLDAIAFIWKEIGTSCVHLPQTHELIQLMREVLHKVAPYVVIITETNVPHEENISYFGSGDDEAQMVYNFALPPLLAYSVLKSDTSILTDWAKTLTLPSDKVCFFNFTASHDGCGLRPVSEILDKEQIEFIINETIKHGGLVSYRSDNEGRESPYELNASYIDIVSDPKEDDDIRAKKMMITQAASLSMPGVAGVYFHSLVGSSSYHEGVRHTGIKRAINREKFNLDVLNEELNDEGNIRFTIFRRYKKLLSIRITERAFNPFGEFEFLSLDKRVFVVYRRCKNCKEDILALHNFSNDIVKLKIPKLMKFPLLDLVSHKKIKSDEIMLDGYQIMWLKGLRNDEKE